jgi:hypothetical protein
MRKEFNGHPSWNCWNVALWLSSDEAMYRAAVEALHSTHTLKHATNVFFGMTGLEGWKTPDGGVFNKTATQRALAGLEIKQPRREY